MSPAEEQCRKYLPICRVLETFFAIVPVNPKNGLHPEMYAALVPVLPRDQMLDWYAINEHAISISEQKPENHCRMSVDMSFEAPNYV